MLANTHTGKQTCRRRHLDKTLTGVDHMTLLQLGTDLSSLRMVTPRLTPNQEIAHGFFQLQIAFNAKLQI